MVQFIDVPKWALEPRQEMILLCNNRFWVPLSIIMKPNTWDEDKLDGLNTRNQQSLKIQNSQMCLNFLNLWMGPTIVTHFREGLNFQSWEYPIKKKNVIWPSI